MILETRPDLGERAARRRARDRPRYPRAARSSSQALTTPLAPGMIFTVEPGLYQAGLGGIRLEDDVVVRGDGPEILSTLPLELVELPV